MTQDEALQRAIESLRPNATPQEACRYGFVSALAWILVQANEAAKQGAVLTIGKSKGTDE